MVRGPSESYAWVCNFFANSFATGDDAATIRRKFQNVTEVTVEDMSTAVHRGAILEGTFRAVTRALGGANNNIMQTFNAVLGVYGQILSEYYATIPSQLRIMDYVESKCTDPQSQFAPFFVGMIRTLANHCLSVEAITMWKRNTQAQEAAGNLSVQNVRLLRALEAMPLGNMAGPSGDSEAAETARNMGF